jgi:hypothetical protein
VAGYAVEGFEAAPTVSGSNWSGDGYQSTISGDQVASQGEAESVAASPATSDTLTIQNGSTADGNLGSTHENELWEAVFKCV